MDDPFHQQTETCHGHGNFQDDFLELLVFFTFTLLTLHFAY